MDNDSQHDTSATQPTYAELQARVAELEATAHSQAKTGIYFKVGEKGGVSVYGIGRFPVTLYYQQWERMLESCTGISPEEGRGYGFPILQFIDEHRSELSNLDGKNASKIQNTVQASLDEALVRGVREYRKVNPSATVAEAESAIRKLMGLPANKV